jgi:hypothetical protein
MVPFQRASMERIRREFAKRESAAARRTAPTWRFACNKPNPIAPTIREFLLATPVR